MKKILNIVEISLLGIAALVVILWMAGVFGPFAHDPNSFGGADITLIITYVYLAAAVLAMVVLTAMNIGKGKGNSKAGLFVWGGLAVLAVIFYFALGSSTPVIGADGTVFDNVFTLKSSDMMLYLAYAALGVTVLILLAGEIRNAIK